MTLLEYFDIFLARIRDKASASSVKNFTATRRALEAYLSQEDNPGAASILAPLAPDWLTKYHHWLSEKYINPYGKRHLSPSAVHRHMQCLRTLLRSAIADGYFPDIEVFDDLPGLPAPTERRGVGSPKIIGTLSQVAALYPQHHPVLRRFMAHRLGLGAPLCEEDRLLIEAIYGSLSGGSEPFPTLAWYAIRIYGRTGSDVIRELDRESAVKLPPGTETYAPADMLTRVRRDGSIRQTRDPLVSRLLFIRTSADGIKSVDRTLRSVYLYTYSDGEGRKIPATIPDVQIERLRFMLRAGGDEVVITSTFTRGMKVRVVRGPLKGLQGEVVDAPDGAKKLSLMIDHIGCALLQVSPADIKAI